MITKLELPEAQMVKVKADRTFTIAGVVISKGMHIWVPQYTARSLTRQHRAHAIAKSTNMPRNSVRSGKRATET